MTTLTHPEQSFLRADSNRGLLLTNALVSLIYFGVICFVFPIGNTLLYALLIGGEVFHTWLLLTYLATVSKMDSLAVYDPHFAPAVDVFITVAGEPLEIIWETALAARDMDYPNHQVYILNDGLVAKKDNWQEVRRLAEELGVGCFTRSSPGGAKAGNINNAVARTTAPYIVIFDADHVPHKDFLKKTIGYFADPKMGFVQTPQYYRNHELNLTTRASWEQQELFYGPICRGKNNFNAVTMCGTNMVISRTALEAAGGKFVESITEDFATGLFIHSKGYRSFYVAEVLAEGLAPEDFLSYSKQQFRWARGALDVIFRYNLFFRRGLTWRQRLQYLASVTYFFSGVVVAIDITLPVIFLYTGMIPLQVSTMLLAAVFIPHILLTIYNLSLTSNYRFTFNAISFSMGAFWIHLKALWSALTGRKDGFAITAKKGIQGNFPALIWPHLLYITVVILGIPVGIHREGLSASVINNTAWAAVNIGLFLPFMLAAMPEWGFKNLSSPETLAKVRVTIVALLTFTWFK